MAKRTGISSMQIKNVLKALTDSSLVRAEKIGIGNYYWSFPSEARVASKAKAAKLQESVASLERERQQAQTQLDREESLRAPLVV